MTPGAQVVTDFVDSRPAYVVKSESSKNAEEATRARAYESESSQEADGQPRAAVSLQPA